MGPHFECADDPRDEDRVARIDLDGTVADYEGEMSRRMAMLKSPDEPDFDGYWDVPPHIEARRKLIKTQPGFWRELPRLERGVRGGGGPP